MGAGGVVMAGCGAFGGRYMPQCERGWGDGDGWVDVCVVIDWFWVGGVVTTPREFYFASWVFGGSRWEGR